MKYLVDTNVVSELIKPKANLDVQTWFDQHDSHDLFLSTLTLGEIAKGSEKASLERRKRLEHWLFHTIIPWFENRILSIDQEISLRWGKLMGAHHRTLSAIDALLAATALTHHLTLVTRNIKDFKDIPHLKVVNPFDELQQNKK